MWKVTNPAGIRTTSFQIVPRRAMYKIITVMQFSSIQIDVKRVGLLNIKKYYCREINNFSEDEEILDGEKIP